LLRVHTPQAATDDLTDGVIVVQHDIEFVAPLVFRQEPIRIETWATRIRAASFTLRYEILDERPDGSRQVYTRASTVLAPYVFATERPRRIQPEERATLERFFEPEAAA